MNELFSNVYLPRSLKAFIVFDLSCVCQIKNKQHEIIHTAQSVYNQVAVGDCISELQEYHR